MKRATAEAVESPKYPSREYTVRRWEQLARDIASAKYLRSEDTRGTPGSKAGSLTVIGSGIQSVGFSLDCVQRIQHADEVFFCVADSATQVWLRELRPDAYDLYVLYDDHKVRYSTYVQMSEAILHFVRRGKNVVTVFYGHPGIFVLSTHRAIAIARREGHRAVMHASVSALDALCADLAIDPSYPGMQTFEATDLLLRRRPLDITLHTVLWQVGLIGEMGYRRRGYINDKFSLLVEYLAEAYGEDHWVTHYIAARYPTIAPTVAHYRISSLLDPANRTTFNGISTFYIAPKIARQNDLEMAVRLGLAQPGQSLGKVARSRPVDRYGPREQEGVNGFIDFRVPDSYQFQRKTRAAEFLVELTRNHKLARLYSTDPRRAVSEDSFPGLSRKERDYLMSRDEGRIQLAAKGMLVAASPDEQFVIDILQQPALARAFKGVLAANYDSKTGRAPIDAWIKEQGYDTCLANFQPAAANVAATMLLPWSAVYQADDGTIITVLGDPVRNSNSQIWLNCSRINDFTFANGTLAWKDFGGGQVTFEVAKGAAGTFQRSISGSVGTESSFSANEVVFNQTSLSDWVGSYKVEVTPVPNGSWEPYGTIEIGRSQSGTDIVALLNGNDFDAKFIDGELQWPASISEQFGQITFARNKDNPAEKSLNGILFPYSPGPFLQGSADPSYSDSFQGQYVAQLLTNGVWGAASPVFLGSTGIVIGASSIPQAVITNGLLQWSGGPPGFGSGKLQFLIDRATQLPYFSGMVWDGSAPPTSPNFRGQFAPKMLDSWSGTYPTTLGSAAGPGLRVVGAAPPNATSVLFQGQPVSAYSFSNGVLSATASDGSVLNATFAYDATTSTRSFKGQLTTSGATQPWISDSASDDVTKWVGCYGTQLASGNGSFVPSATIVQIEATSAADYTVVLSDGTTTKTLTPGNVVFDPAHDTLSWYGQTGTPGNNAYANASIAFVRNDARSSLTFIGSYWGAGQKPPAEPNWCGAFDQAPSSGGLAPWQIVLIVLGSVSGVAVIAAAICSRFCSRVAEQSTEIEMECLVCKEKIDLASVDYAIGAAADPCQEEEEEAEEEEEGLDADDADAAEANPADMPAESGLSAEAEPNVNVDVDTDVDVDVNIDVDVDVDVDVDIDIDIDVDVLFVDIDVDVDVDIDTDIDNVTDTVDVTDVDTVSVIST